MCRCRKKILVLTTSSAVHFCTGGVPPSALGLFSFAFHSLAVVLRVERERFLVKRDLSSWPSAQYDGDEGDELDDEEPARGT